MYVRLSYLTGAELDIDGWGGQLYIEQFYISTTLKFQYKIYNNYILLVSAGPIEFSLHHNKLLKQL